MGRRKFKDGELYKREKARQLLEQLGEPVPDSLQRKVVKRVRSKIGTLTLREQTGMQPSPAASIVKQFDENIKGDREALATSIQASGERLNERDQALVALILSPRGKKLALARAVTEAGADPVRMMDLYTKGCVVLKKMEAIREAAEAMPQVVKNLVSHAASEIGDTCRICVGTGEVARVANSQSAPAAQVECPVCKGAGRRLKASELKEFAAEKLLEINKLTEKGGGIQVQTNVGVVAGGGGGSSILERIRKAADETLYRKSEEVVEAEVVSS